MRELEMEYHPVPLDYIYDMCEISPLHQNIHIYLENHENHNVVKCYINIHKLYYTARK